MFESEPSRFLTIWGLDGRGKRADTLQAMADPVAELRSAVEAAADSLVDGADSARSQPTLERPPKAEFGDYRSEEQHV